MSFLNRYTFGLILFILNYQAFAENSFPIGVTDVPAPWQSLLAEEGITFYQQPTTPTASQWYNQAQQLEAEGRYAEAVSAYNAVMQTPDATQQTCIACTWAHRGLCFERLGDYGNVASSYTQALQHGDIPFACEGSENATTATT